MNLEIKDTDKLTNMPAIKVSDLNSCRRLFTRMITLIQKEEIGDKQARLLTYVLSAFVNVFKEAEFEERIKKLEERACNES